MKIRMILTTLLLLATSSVWGQNEGESLGDVARRERERRRAQAAAAQAKENAGSPASPAAPPGMASPAPAPMAVVGGDAGRPAARPWTNVGLVGGAVSTLAIDPKNPGTLYAGSRSAGLFKSTDGGANWNLVNSGLANTNLMSLAIDPQNSTTLYAGTGEVGPPFDLASRGVYKSTNGGVAWRRSLPAPNSTYFTSLAIDPQNTNTVYAGSGAGVFKTTDGGGNWTAMPSGLSGCCVAALAIDPRNPSTIYAASSEGIFKSLDRGAKWSLANSGLPSRNYIPALVIDPQNTSILYAGTRSGVFKSTNGGANWNAASTGLPAGPIGGPPPIAALVIDPRSPSTLFVSIAGVPYGIFKTTDGGATWINTGYPQAAVNSLAIDPQNSATIYAGAYDGGVDKNTNGGMQPPPPLQLPCPPGYGQVGAAYSSALVANGGTGSYRFSIPSGSLPPGLTLNPTSWAMSGAPDTAGNFDFTAQVIDSSGTTAIRACTIRILPATPAAITEDSGRQQGAETQAQARREPQRPPITFRRPTADLKDCGTDFTCFMKALADAKPAFVRRTRSAGEKGVNVSGIEYSEVSDITKERTTYYTRMEDVNIEVTDEGRKQMMLQGASAQEIERMMQEVKQGQEEMKKRELVCYFATDALKTLLQNWSRNQYSPIDFERAEQCEGDGMPMGAGSIPLSPVTHRQRAWFLSEDGKTDEAEKELRLAADKDPDYEKGEAHRLLGELYEGQNKQEQALEEFRQAAQSDPQSAQAWSALGRAYYQQGDLGKAAESFRKQIEVHNQRSFLSNEPYDELCEVYFKQDLYDKAVELCEEGVKKFPDDFGLWNNLAWFYATSNEARYKNPRKALEYAQKAVSLSTERRPELLDTLAEAYFASGNFDKAIETESEVLELSPGTTSFKDSLDRFRRAKSAGKK